MNSTGGMVQMEDGSERESEERRGGRGEVERKQQAG